MTPDHLPGAFLRGFGGRESPHLLPRIQLVIPALLLDELVVGATLDDAALLQHHDAVGVLHCAQPVGDDKCQTAGEAPWRTSLLVEPAGGPAQSLGQGRGPSPSYRPCRIAPRRSIPAAAAGQWLPSYSGPFPESGTNNSLPNCSLANKYTPLPLESEFRKCYS